MFMTKFAIVFKFMAAKCKSNSTESTNQALAKSATRGTAMVITVSITFVILTAPTALDLATVARHSSTKEPLYYQVFMNVHSVSEPQYQWCIVLHCGVQIQK